ncbi:MAG: dihydrolipoyl dehydrogenase [Coxiellaceae bacterium]|nr:dihydrolipoyl dehydrogenase [Coxiellaceae bacterium]|tara:strand:- start:7283 stop:8707 length:1425 start_codon:yes stop_codon:yes gene_type:complete
MTQVIETDVVVLGSGPGGYSAAYRAADLGLEVAMIERYSQIGGVCLNVGCIPSKALLHVAKVLADAKDASVSGVKFSDPEIDVDQLKSWKDGVVNKLTGGLTMMAKQRKVNVIHGYGEFADANTITVVGDSDEPTTIKFKHCIIAAGSKPIKLPFIPDDPRIFDSTGALQLEHTQGDMLVLGGGIIGLEMATVYSSLGANISVVEMLNQLMPGADKDLVAPYHKRIAKEYEAIMLETSVTQVEAKEDGLWVTFEGKQAPETNPKRFDSILCSVGRKPNGALIGADKAGVNVDERGFIAVDKQMRTNIPHIFAIGDIVGNPMLAHKASHEGRLAAEVISGKKHYFDAKCIPSVAYTDPEIAWVGITEQQAKEQNIAYEKGVFPWMASGRALAMERTEGMTKVLFDEHHRIIGGGVVGLSAGDLIAEIGLAIEMGCDAEDIALTIHPHPTLSESVMMATEVFEGTITDLYIPKKKK